MSRSVHTTPAWLRAPRRVRDPFARRGAGDPRANYAGWRVATELGRLSLRDLEAAAEVAEPPLPRLRVTLPRSGYGHPVGRTEIVAVLQFFGAVCTYGLREVVLARRPALPQAGLHFGTLLVPGRIVLYEQPCPPWSLPGALTPRDAAHLRRAGAIVERSLGGWRTTVDWPDETLRDFWRFDVLMHEIGHH